MSSYAVVALDAVVAPTVYQWAQPLKSLWRKALDYVVALVVSFLTKKNTTRRPYYPQRAELLTLA